MLSLSIAHIIGIVATMALLLAIGVVSGRKVKDGRSFATGGKAGSWMVCGTIMGTLVGGQSTIGTAQMAFCYGYSAWWFTIGTALGTLVLALRYVGPLRRSGCTTLTEIVGREYGSRAESIGSVLCVAGIFISIVAQILSSGAMMTSLFGMSLFWAAIVSALFILLFVLFGGIKSAGAGGIVKMVLLYLSSIVAGVVVFGLSGGLSGLNQSVASVFECQPLAEANGICSAEAVHDRYNSLVARGAFKDIGAALSLILGVLSTQTYAQAVWSACSDRAARRGAMLCVFLTPFIGAACTLVGLFMRAHYVTESEMAWLAGTGLGLPAGMGVIESAAQAFPSFIMNHLPAWLGGIMLGTLFVTILGGGSGLALGAATIMVEALGGRKGRSNPSKAAYRGGISLLLLIAVVVALSVHETFINDLGFLSLGLRATALLFPLCCALFFPKRFARNWAIGSMVVGTVVMLVAYCLSFPLDPSYWGIFAGLIVMLCGIRRKRQAPEKSTI